MTTTRSFENRIKAGFAAVAIILGLITMLAVGNSQNVRNANVQADRTQEALRDLQQVLITMLDAETGMRGYLITGDTTYLEPYERALATVDARMAKCRAMLSNSATFAELEVAVAEQLRFRTNFVTRIQSATDKELAPRGIRIDEGKIGMDRIRQIVQDLQKAEETALAERRRQSEKSDEGAMGLLMVFVLFTIVLLVGGVALVRHHMRARIKVEEERNRFFTLSHDMYCVAGADGFFKEVNTAGERILGYSAAELKSQPFIEFVHPEDRAATEAEAGRLAAGEPTIYFENRYRTKDGSYKWMLWSAAPMPGEKLIYAVARDISVHKEAEQKLIRMTEEEKLRIAELESVNKELEAFSYSVSHDLRAPVRHIAGFSDMLHRQLDGKLDEKGDRFLKTIMESAKRMGNLIDDLLIFSRMGRSEMHRKSIDLNAMVDEVIAEFPPDVTKRKIHWTKEKLPATDGDGPMLRQVWANLISNAVKYTGERAVAEITIGWRDEPEEQVFFVRDNGAGFDMTYAHKLFGVFQRLHEASQFEGTGIGLANVRRIISRHGGRTWAEATLDKGATFYFSLPKLKAKANAAAQTNPIS